MAALLVVLLFSIATNLSAEEITPGVEYQGPRDLGIKQYGVSFKLPAGWTGGLPKGEDTFVIGRAGGNGYIFIAAEETTVAQAKVEMSKTLPMAEMTLTPNGAAKISGREVSNDYKVTGGATELVGHATTLVGGTGLGVTVLAIAAPTELPAFQKAATSIVKSLKIVKPKAPKVSTNGYWGRMFAGKRIIRFFTGSGYSEKRQILMCPNGTFVYRFDGGGFDMSGFSGAAQSKNGGSWSASGDSSGGVLKLIYGDGRMAEYNLAEKDGKLMVDGGRWFREAIDCR